MIKDPVHRGPAPDVNGSCAMTKAPLLDPETPACACRGGIFEASLPVSRPTTSL
jgi:hypothetical protein